MFSGYIVVNYVSRHSLYVQIIEGEIYDVDDRLLEWMDSFEGHPEVYERDRVLVELLTGDGDRGDESRDSDVTTTTTTCWSYFLKRFPPQLLDVESYSNYEAFGINGKPYQPE